MDFTPQIESLKAQAEGSLKQLVYEQAQQHQLAETVLKSIVEGAVDKFKLPASPVGAVASEVMGMLGGLTSAFGGLAGIEKAAESMGLVPHIEALLKQHGIDTALRDSVIQGMTKYLEENAGHFMKVAVDAVLAKLTPPR